MPCVTVTWSDEVTAVIDLSSVIEKENVFAPMQDAAYFGKMRTAACGLLPAKPAIEGELTSS
jgi:hypothetical protein